MIKKVFIICSLCLLMGVGFTFMWQAADNSENSDLTEREAGKGYGSVAEQKTEEGNVKDTENEKYLLVLEGKNLCAYIIKGDEKTLLKSLDFPSNLIESGEISKLTGGIYASTYEELCLYLESYIS